MPKTPFSGSFPMTQDWNDPRYRASYAKFGLQGHNGQDFGCPMGTPIIAPHAGRIIESALDSTGYGWYVKIENDKEGSILGHFKQAPLVSVGASVTQGQPVGLSGSTGNSTGPHLHWGYYRFPRKRDNGFSGTVDQTHWMNQDDENYLDELIDMRASRDKWKSQYSDLEKKYVKDTQSATEHAKNLQSTVSEQNNTIQQMQKTIVESEKEKTRLLGEYKASQTALVAMTTEKNNEISALSKKLEKQEAKCQEVVQEVQKLKEKISLKLKGYKKWELFLGLFKK